MATPSSHHPITPRRVAFDFSDTPLHWITDEPTATHVINVLHLLLPAGERWFVKVIKEAAPLVTDARLRSEVHGFMGQESTHSVQHSHVLDHLAAQGLDTRPYTRHVDWIFNVLLGDRPPAGLPLSRREWLKVRLAVVAAVEQFTAVLGDWVLHAGALDDAGSDPAMLDLLRWHGAEEVEHRSVAFDLYQHAGGRPLPRYVRRVEGMALTAPVLLWLCVYGTAYLIRNDPQLRGTLRYSLREHNRAIAKGLLPSWRALGSAIPRYLRRSYHPSQEGSLYLAVQYLAKSPAARRATTRAGRPATF
ncbi:metal-dependent hydrolase [Streptomyces sp. SL13]|uniref:Metal-dependent hydrolase n=1 Tax=Streptantibioticus silvisoli TaxID=2705255 RepID=A0AA90H9K5_9ACTN|nr:metal-dependent hydrolase [Streptantibioticus silvisoli]MDI5970492.1 metal-dependent hydrolase [Streptantibioticus silvisoli]